MLDNIALNTITTSVNSVLKRFTTVKQGIV